jgi:hypothetical protein
VVFLVVFLLTIRSRRAGAQGKVRAKVIDDTTNAEMRDFREKNVEFGLRVHSDEAGMHWNYPAMASSSNSSRRRGDRVELQPRAV